jgi:hypothetical protein
MCDTTTRPAPRQALSRPRWGLLYAAMLPQLAALALVEAAEVPDVTRIALRLALVLGAFAAMAVWIRRNRAAIDLLDWCACAGETLTIREIRSHRPLPAALPPDRSLRPAREWVAEPWVEPEPEEVAPR